MHLHRSRLRLSALVLAIGGILFLQAGAASAGTCADVKNAKAFFDAVRSKVHKAISDDQLDSYKCLFAYWQQLNIEDKRWLSYAMATGWHEARMAPLREGGGSHAKAVSAAKWAYDKGLTKRAYHLPDPATGKIYYGRGLVQLTWASNYQKMGQTLGMGDALYRNPDLVLQPDIATKVMLQGMIQGKFCSENNASIIKKCTGLARSSLPSRLNVYFNSKCAEWYRARRMINGDLAKTANRIAGYAKSYLSGMGTMPIPVSAGTGDVIPTEAPKPEDEFLPPAEEEVGGIVPLTGDAVAPEETGVTVPLTGLNEGMGGMPGDGGAAATPPAAPAPETIAVDKPVAPATGGEAIAPLVAPGEGQPAAPTDSTGGGTAPATTTDGGGAAPAAPSAPTTAEAPAAPSAPGDTATATPPATTTVPPAETGGTTTATTEPAKPAGEIVVADATPATTAGGALAADAAITAAEAAAVAELQAALEVQKAEVAALKNAQAAQQKAVDDARAAAEGAKKAADDSKATIDATKVATDANKAAIETVAKSVDASRGRLDEIGQRLQQMGDAIATLAKEIAAMKAPPAATPDAGSGKPAAEGEPGWFGKTMGTIKGYIWKSN